MALAEKRGNDGARRRRIAALAVLLVSFTAASHAQFHRHRNGLPPPGQDEQDAALRAHERTLPVLDPAQMRPEDRALLQQREVDVSRAAAFYGFDISDSHWTYQQVLCHSLPDHLILSFGSDSAEHGASHFMAVVPANGDKVQVVTEFAHGLLPFRAAWEKSAAYQAFNHMAETDRGEHALSGESHWLNLGMCFVALTGQLPHVGQPAMDLAASEALAKRNGTMPTILIEPGKSAEVRFSDVSNERQTGNWSLRFDGKGRLVKAQLDAVKPGPVTTSPILPLPTPVQPD